MTAAMIIIVFPRLQRRSLVFSDIVGFPNKHESFPEKNFGTVKREAEQDCLRA
jgi:hypothetical protein